MQRPVEALGTLALAPYSSRAFVGRDEELRRVVSHVEQDVVFAVYGVAGIGKTEFAYRAIEHIRQEADWRDATPVLVRAPEKGAWDSVVASLRMACSADSGRRAPLVGGTSAPSAELEVIARGLEARRFLVLVDDVHHLGVDRASTLLSYLGRHVSQSRVIVTSCAEIPFERELVPVEIRLQPLEDAAARKLVRALAARLGVHVKDAEPLLGRAAGSPLLLQRGVAALGTGLAALPETTNPIDASLRELSPDAMRLLLAASLLSGSVGADDLVAPGRDLEDMRLLVRRFLVAVERGQVVVHELVREAVLARTSSAELAAAHERAATVSAARYALDPTRSPLAGVEAVRHLLAAGSPQRAYAFVVEHGAALGSAGLDHLLLPSLEAMREAVADRRVDIELRIARTLIRRSAIAEAREVLSRIGQLPEARGNWRYLTLEGVVAQRLGQLEAAERSFRAAMACCSRPEDTTRIAFHLADVLSLGGRGAEARQTLDQVRESKGVEADSLRMVWSRALSLVFELRFEEARAAVARVPRRQLDRVPDMASQLAMLEALTSVELDDVSSARASLAPMLAAAAPGNELREMAGVIYRGIVAWSEGDLGLARSSLEGAHRTLVRNGDVILGCIAGHYLGRTMLAQGVLTEAVRVFAETTQAARDAGLASLVPMGRAFMARTLLAMGRVADARAEANAVLADPCSLPHSRDAARRVIAMQHAVLGDLTGARALFAEQTAAPGDRGAAFESLLDRAQFELLGGDPQIVVDCATQASLHYASEGRRYKEAHASVVLAAGHVAMAGPDDRILAQVALERAQELGSRMGYPQAVLGASLMRAALAQREGDEPRARKELEDALRTTAAMDVTVISLAIRAALGGGERSVPGVMGMLRLLGLAKTGRHPIIDRLGARDVSEADLRSLQRKADLLVDLSSGTLKAPRTGRTSAARPLVAALVSRLVREAGGAVGPEELYRDVWGGREYHPLRHRNTVYVAVNRARLTLRQMLGDRPAIDRSNSGWRIADGLEVVVLCAPATSPAARAE